MIKRMIVLGAYIMGQEEINKPVPYTIPIQPGIARTPTPSGPQIGSRSPQPIKPYRQVAPSRSDCTIQVTGWSLNRTGPFNIMPSFFLGDVVNGTWYFQAANFAVGGPFTRGIMRISGVNPWNDFNSWFLAGVCANSAAQRFFPQQGDFTIDVNMSDNDIANYNNGFDRTEPSCLSLIGTSHGPSITAITYFLFV